MWLCLAGGTWSYFSGGTEVKPIFILAAVCFVVALWNGWERLT
jgi:hypothetical protein